MGTPSPIETKLTLGKYDLIEKLGDRSLGPVYRGFDQELGRAVVIRILSDGIKWAPKIEELFHQGCRSAANLQHPNIAAIYEINKEAASHYIVMESLGNRSLEKLIAQKSPMPVETKLWIMTQVADGLHYAHKRGVLHLDLSPDKIHVTPDGTAKIRDFAITHVLMKHLPRPVVRWGAPIYLSPEQVQNQACDERSDIFSLGTIFYEFLTYLHPFHDPNGNKALDNIILDSQFPTFEQFSDLPPGIWTILKTCLARDPNDRYRSMEDLANAGRELLASLSEDKQLMLAELYAALNPLRKIASQPGAPAEALRLLDEIEKLAKGEHEALYANLDRLMSDLIEQYPLIHSAANAPEAANAGFFVEPAKIPAPQPAAAPVEGAPQEPAEALPEERLDLTPPAGGEPDPVPEVPAAAEVAALQSDDRAETASPAGVADATTTTQELQPPPIPVVETAEASPTPDLATPDASHTAPVRTETESSMPGESDSAPKAAPVSQYRKARGRSYKPMVVLLSILLLAVAGYLAWGSNVQEAVQKIWQSLMAKSQTSMNSFLGKASYPANVATSADSKQTPAQNAANPNAQAIAAIPVAPLDTPLDADARRLFDRVSAMIDSGMLQPARIELAKLQDIYPDTPELARLRRRLPPTNRAAAPAQARRKDEEQQKIQRRQKEEEWNRQASALFAGGKYEEAGAVLNTWQADSPGNPQSQELGAKIDEMQKSLRVYASAMSENHYQEALNALHNAERINPSDPNLAGLRRQSESRKANARAMLTIHRLGAKGALLLDGRPIGRDGELDSEAIPIGQHTLSIENDGNTVASRSLEFSEGQRLTLVYDVSKQSLRTMSESDRELMAQRKFMEQVHSFDLEHYHGVLRGSCRGTLLLDYPDIAFKPASGSHGFRIPFKLIKMGKVEEKTVELLYIADNQRFQTFRFQDARSLERFRQVWSELKTIAAR